MMEAERRVSALFRSVPINPMDVVQSREERKAWEATKEPESLGKSLTESMLEDIQKIEDFKGTVDGKGFKGVMKTPKLPIELIPPAFVKEVSTVLLHGATKYAPNNWMRGMSYTTVYGAIQRHLNAWFSGEDLDPESGLNHLAHAACGLAFLAHYRSREEYSQFDDRVFK